MTAQVVRLRQAGLDDVKAVREILAAAAEDLTSRCGQGHWSTVRTIETLRKYAESGTLYVMEAGADRVGVLRLTDRKIGFYHDDWFARAGDPAGYLLDMAVHPDAQRRGVGRRALELIGEIAADAGLGAIRLDAYKGPAGAGGFYRKCGYRLVHEAAFRGVALEYFERLLPPRP